MKALMQTIAFMLITCIVFGQDIAGEWNGALSVQGNQIRVTFHIKKNNGKYEATLDSPDQNANGITVTATEFNYPKVKFEISGLEAVYEGTLSDKNISGRWMQSGTALFLALVKKEE